jgi:hypothetical protein
MEDTMRLLEAYNALVLRMLPDFWGFTLSRTPELERAKKRTSLVSEGRIRLSDKDIETYISTLSYETNGADIAFFHLSARTLNHVFALTQNDSLSNALLFPTNPTPKTALIEAVASVPTCWAIDHWHEYSPHAKQQDGARIVLKYYRLRKQQLENEGKTPQFAEKSERLYEDLKKMSLPDFRGFVKSYTRG